MYVPYLSWIHGCEHNLAWNHRSLIFQHFRFRFRTACFVFCNFCIRSHFFSKNFGLWYAPNFRTANFKSFYYFHGDNEVVCFSDISTYLTHCTVNLTCTSDQHLTTSNVCRKSKSLEFDWSWTPGITNKYKHKLCASFIFCWLLLSRRLIS